VKTVKRKVLVIAVALMAVAMLAVPMFSAHATKPVTMTLTGIYYIVGGGSMEVIEAGQSGNVLFKIKDLGCVWTGDITAGSLGTWPDPTVPPVPGGVYNGQWLVKPTGEGAFPGRLILEDVTIAGIGTGDLTLGAKQDKLWIESGTGDLSSIRGKGTQTEIAGIVVLGYTLEVQINP
jgi:hypothetical protein